MQRPIPFDALSGQNQRGVRNHNERLILTTLQRDGFVPGSEIARRTGLSPQTVSVILRALENDGLLRRGAPKRGKVGKPSVPMGIAPRGAYSVGLKIGRRSVEALLSDLSGDILVSGQATYRYPSPGDILEFLQTFLRKELSGLPAGAADRIAGIGIAQPHELWAWPDEIGATNGELEAWRMFDLAGEVGSISQLPVFVENDATAASRAEQLYGAGRAYRDYAYFFVGSFIGGGVVLNNAVFEGRTGHAGAFGSLPMQDARREKTQLIDTASLHLLEAELVRQGHDPFDLWTRPQDWSAFSGMVDAWIDGAAPSLARAALSVCAVIDFEAVMIDGGFPPEVRDALVARTARELDQLDWRGLARPELVAGSVGASARALGAAAAPILHQYFLTAYPVSPQS